MQAIDVLGDDEDITGMFSLQPGQRGMGRIGRGFSRLRAPLIVEIHHKRGVLGKPFGCCDVFDPVLRPKPAFVAERPQPAFGRNARARQNHDICHSFAAFPVDTPYKTNNKSQRQEHMFGNETPIFTFRGPFGVPVEVGGSIIFLALLFVGFGATSSEALMQGLIMFAMVVLAIFLHEFGHAWGARVQGVPVHKVVIYGGGGYCQTASRGARESELIVAMGPIVNLALWAISSLAAWYVLESVSGIENLTPEQLDGLYKWYVAYGYLQTFAWINLVLFVLNLVPVQPLDGGKLFHLALLRVMPQMPALRLAGIVGLVFAVLWVPAMLFVYFEFGWMLLFIPPIMVHWQMAKGNISL